MALDPHLDAPPSLAETVFENQYGVASVHFADHARARQAVGSAEDWPARREGLVAAYREMLGAFPERTPLRPRQCGALERAGLTIEKVIFESRPELYVTANLYLPHEAPRPAPAVLVACGHAQNGKAYENYQRVCLGLAARGFVALIYDPISQGERLQYPDPDTGGSRVGGCTTEHTFCGNQCTLAGASLAQYMIGDSIRALDYLESRPEVDATRLGMTGCSGGGTNTTYTAPLDERIQAAYPVCYVTNWEQRMLSRGIADAEQNLFGCIPAGLDHHELCAMVAPRALQIGAAKEDYFPIEGTREAFAAAQRVYELLGVPEKISLVEVEGGHGYDRPLREACYAWMCRWLGDPDAPSEEQEAEVASEEELWCTKSGQVAELSGRTVFALNREFAAPRRVCRPELASAEDARQWQAEMRGLVAETLAIDTPPGLLASQALGEDTVAGCRCEHVRFVSETGIVIAADLYLPEHRRGGPVIWLHEEGKAGVPPEAAAALAADGGGPVLVPDLRGIGESTPPETGRDRGDKYTALTLGEKANIAFDEQILGRTMLGRRAFDVIRCLAYLEHRGEAVAGVELRGSGEAALWALSAAAADERFGRVRVERLLASWRSVVETEYYWQPFSALVPGALSKFEICDVAALIAPRPLAIVSATDAAGEPLAGDEVDRAFAWAREVYSAAGAGDELVLAEPAA